MITLSKKLIDQYVDRIDPRFTHLKRATKSMLIAAIGTALAFYFKSAQGLWLILTGLFLMQCFTGTTLRFRINCLLICSVITIPGIFIFTLLGQWYWAFAIGLSITTFIAFYLRKFGMDVTLASLFVLITLLVAGGLPGNLAIAITRLEFSAISALICIIIATLIWPYRPKAHLQKLLDTNTLLIKEYMNGMFLDFLWGEKENCHASLYQERVLARIDQARTLLQHYPDRKRRLRLMRQITTYGQILALNNLFAMPKERNVLITLLTEIDSARRLLYRLFETIHQPGYEEALQATKNFLNNFKSQAQQSEDAASFHFIVTEIVHQLRQHHHG